jgi:hypothetical protein
MNATSLPIKVEEPSIVDWTLEYYNQALLRRPDL